MRELRRGRGGGGGRDVILNLIMPQAARVATRDYVYAGSGRGRVPRRRALFAISEVKEVVGAGVLVLPQSLSVSAAVGVVPYSRTFTFALGSAVESVTTGTASVS